MGFQLPGWVDQSLRHKVAGWLSSDSAEPPFTEEEQALLRQVEAAIPTIDRGKSWFELAVASASVDHPFVEVYQDQILDAAPELRKAATSAWIDLVDDPAFRDRLEPDMIIRLLAAMVIWQIAATQRALARAGVDAQELEPILWMRLSGEIDQYLQDQEIREQAANQVRSELGAGRVLFAVAVVAPDVDADESSEDLIRATQESTGTSAIDGFDKALGSAWRVKDVATIAVLYRSFGEALERQEAMGVSVVGEPTSRDQTQDAP